MSDFCGVKIHPSIVVEIRTYGRSAVPAIPGFLLFDVASCSGYTQCWVQAQSHNPAYQADLGRTASELIILRY